MKKLTAVLSAALLLLSAAVFTSCSEDDPLLGPQNVWCTIPVEYQSSTNDALSASLYVSFYYTKEEKTGDSTGSKLLKKGYTIPAGITMVVTGTSDSSEFLAELTDNTYIIKTFPLGEDATYDDGDEGSTSSKLSFKANRAWWTALYLLKSDLRNTDNQDENPPYVLTNAGKASTELSWDSVKEEFSWKKLLAAYLLGE